MTGRAKEKVNEFFSFLFITNKNTATEHDDAPPHLPRHMDDDAERREDKARIKALEARVDLLENTLKRYSRFDEGLGFLDDEREAAADRIDDLESFRDVIGERLVEWEERWEERWRSVSASSSTTPASVAPTIPTASTSTSPAPADPSGSNSTSPPRLALSPPPAPSPRLALSPPPAPSPRVARSPSPAPTPPSAPPLPPATSPPAIPQLPPKVVVIPATPQNSQTQVGSHAMEEPEAPPAPDMVGPETLGNTVTAGGDVEMEGPTPNPAMPPSPPWQQPPILTTDRLAPPLPEDQNPRSPRRSRSRSPTPASRRSPRLSPAPPPADIDQGSMEVDK